jgi:hypothetical protein
MHGISSQKSIYLKSCGMPHSVSGNYEFLVLYVIQNNTYASTCLTACTHLAIQNVSSIIKHKLRHYKSKRSNHLFHIWNFFLSVTWIEKKQRKCNIPLHTIRGNGDIAPPILYLGTRRGSVVNFMSSKPESWEKSSQCWLSCRLGGPQSPFGHVGEQKISFPFWEFNHDSLLIQPTAQALPHPAHSTGITSPMPSQCSDRNSHNELEECTKNCNSNSCTWHMKTEHMLCV